MAVLSSINVDSDGIPSAAGTDSVPTLVDVITAVEALAALIDSGALLTKLDPTTVNANGREAAADSAPVVLSTEDKTALDAIVTDAAAIEVLLTGMDADTDAIKTATQALGTGLSVFRSLDLDETEEEVKATAGKLWKLRITNFATAPVYVKLYNATAANVTVGSTTPIDTIVVPAASASDATVLTETFGGKGLTFSTALSMAATTALADADTGAPAGNACVVSAYYE